MKKNIIFRLLLLFVSLVKADEVADNIPNCEENGFATKEILAIEQNIQTALKNNKASFFAGMQDSVFPIAVAHGEGRVEFANTQDVALAQVALRYVDHDHQVTENYPFNPNGSKAGMAALTSQDGRATIIMPHPERVFRAVTNSWHPQEWREDAPTMRLFRNARKWLG